MNHKQQPINGQPSGLKISTKKPLHKNWFLIITLAVVVTIITVVIILFTWYQIQLSPVGSDVSRLKKVTIASGSTSVQIGKELEKQSIIRSATAFDIYIRLSCKNSVLQAGSYR